MIHNTELYPILVFYANKNNSPFIGADDFLDFLGRTAKPYAAMYPAWNKWVHNMEVKFWAEMSDLVEEGKCEFVSEVDSSHH